MQYIIYQLKNFNANALNLPVFQTIFNHSLASFDPASISGSAESGRGIDEEGAGGELRTAHPFS